MSSTASSEATVKRGPEPTAGVGMRELLAANAAAAAVCTPPKPAPAQQGKPEAKAQGTTVTRVPVGAKSQSD
ncbi:hypothetical protein ACIGXM_00795 [Kitasatospora sp. NPDC052896]|uniref:hypothetical protein n=1 Tax=Kitasatospora sp. NPDC052896 TaxID=3364061 RepID=UPI0037CAFBFE